MASSLDVSISLMIPMLSAVKEEKVTNCLVIDISALLVQALLKAFYRCTVWTVY